MIHTLPIAQPVVLPEAQELLDQLPVAVIDLSAAGTVIFANRLGCQVFQMQREELIGMGAWGLMAAEEVEKSRAAFFATIQSHEDPQPIRRTFYTKNGEFHTYDIFRSRILDSQGHTLGLRHVLIDVSQNCAESEKLEQEHHWLQNMLASISEAVIAFDALGFIRYVNPAAEALTGYGAREMVGQQIEKMLPLLSYVSVDENPFSHRAQLKHPCKGIATALRCQGETLTLEIDTSPILDQTRGYTVGVVSCVRGMDKENQHGSSGKSRTPTPA
jgi:PAS domain S-box-containing protein